MDIGARIKTKRKECKFTQIELAKLVNVSSQVISNWERGYSDLSSNDVARLADALGCSTEYLLGKTESAESNRTVRQENARAADEEFEAFAKNPELERWYKDLPKSEEEDLEALKQMWEIIKRNKK